MGLAKWYLCERWLLGFSLILVFILGFAYCVGFFDDVFHKKGNDNGCICRVSFVGLSAKRGV